MHAVDSCHSCFADDEEGCGNLRNAVEDMTLLWMESDAQHCGR